MLSIDLRRYSLLRAGMVLCSPLSASAAIWLRYKGEPNIEVAGGQSRYYGITVDFHALEPSCVTRKRNTPTLT